MTSRQSLLALALGSATLLLVGAARGTTSAAAAPVTPTPPGATAAPRTVLPVPIRIVDPPLSDSLRHLCKPGYAMVRLQVNVKGLVVSSQLIKPFPVSQCVDSSDARRIDDLATRVTQGWAFLPANTGGVSQSMLVDVPIYVPTDTLHVPRHDGTVMGQVLDASSGAPMHGITVKLEGTPLTNRTDFNGWFRFDGLVRLRTVVSAERFGFVPDTVLAEVVPGRVDTLRVHLRALASAHEHSRTAK